MQITSARNISNTAQILDGVIESADIKDGDVAAVDIATDAVETAKIKDANVTTGKLADDAVTVEKMAAGTDGELITYDSSGNPAKVAVGTAGQYLVSNGPGAAPTFQDNADVPTRQFFVPILNKSAGGSGNAHPYDTFNGNFLVCALGATDDAQTWFRVPDDFTSVVEVLMIYYPSSTTTFTYDINTWFDPSSVDFGTTADAIANGTHAGTVNRIGAPDIAAAFTGISAGDFVQVKIASDSADFWLMGLQFKYA